MAKLTAKQELFVSEYLKDLNATQACLRAGYCKKNPSNADKVGPQVLALPSVAAAIEKARGKQFQRLQIEADDVLRELFLIATCDIGEAYGDDGKLKPIKEIPPHVRRAMSSIKVFDEFEGFGREREKIGETTEVRFWNKNDALDKLGRHFKLFTDVVKVTGDDLALRVAKARARTTRRD